MIKKGKLVCLIGIDGTGKSTHINRIIDRLSENDISFHQVSTSEISFSLVVDTNKAKEVARLLSKEFEI